MPVRTRRSGSGGEPQRPASARSSERRHNHQQQHQQQQQQPRQHHPRATAASSSTRKVTSAIPGLSVAEVRRVLDAIRKSWSDREADPFELSAHAIGDLDVQSFALAFVVGQHQKRHARKRRASSSSEEA